MLISVSLLHPANVICFVPSLFPGGSDGKESACNTGDLGLMLELGRSPAEKNSNPLQYSCLENPMERGAWWAAVHGVAKSRTQLKQISMQAKLNRFVFCFFFSVFVNSLSEEISMLTR